MMFVCWSKTYINIRSWSTCNSHWINLFICIDLSAYRSLRWDINTTAIYRKPLRVKFNVFNDGRLSSWIIGSSNNIEVVAIDSFEFVPLNCTQGHSLNRSSSLCRKDTPTNWILSAGNACWKPSTELSQDMNNPTIPKRAIKRYFLIWL